MRTISLALLFEERLGGDPTRGDDDCANAAQHAMGMCLIAGNIDPVFAKALGDLNEDSALLQGGACISSAMDLHNNNIGISLRGRTIEECQPQVTAMMREGKLVFIDNRGVTQNSSQCVVTLP